MVSNRNCHGSYCGRTVCLHTGYLCFVRVRTASKVKVRGFWLAQIEKVSIYEHVVIYLILGHEIEL